VDQDHEQWISPEMIVKEFKKCCTSDEMNGREDDEEVGNVGNKHECVSSECETENGIYEDSEPETGHGNGELSENDEAE
jgi:hypothetical protein